MPLNGILDYIEKNLDCVFVREQVNGKWQSIAIKDLSVERAISHAFRLVRETLDKTEEPGDSTCHRQLN